MGQVQSTVMRALSGLNFLLFIGLSAPVIADDETVVDGGGELSIIGGDFDLLSEQEADALLNELLSTLPGAAGNASAIQQVGNDNQAMLNILGDRNRTVQIQLGSGNLSTIDLTGNDNSAFTRQLGDNNTAGITVDGSGHRIGIDQIGNGFSLDIERTGTGTSVPWVIRQQ